MFLQDEFTRRLLLFKIQDSTYLTKPLSLSQTNTYTHVPPTSQTHLLQTRKQAGKCLHHLFRYSISCLCLPFPFTVWGEGQNEPLRDFKVKSTIVVSPHSKHAGLSDSRPQIQIAKPSEGRRLPRLGDLPWELRASGTRHS